MEATDAAVVGHALYVVIITRRTRYARPAHPLLRQEAHPIQRPTLGKHGEEPRGAARVHDAAGTRQTGPPHVSPSKYLLGRPHLRRNRQRAERSRGHPRRAGRDRWHIGKGGHPRFNRIRDAHPEAVEVQWLTDFILDEGAKLPAARIGSPHYFADDPPKSIRHVGRLGPRLSNNGCMSAMRCTIQSQSHINSGVTPRGMMGTPSRCVRASYTVALSFPCAPNSGQ